MRVPQNYLAFLPNPRSGFEPSFFPLHLFGADGRWTARLPDELLIYPPVGFLAWPFCSIGNGDDYGFYWPVGKEDEPPIVGMMSHDCGALNPIASSLEGLERMGDYPELRGLLGRPVPPAESRPSANPDIAHRLGLDGDSPYLLVANADAAVGRIEYDLAESLYHRALARLPEYTAAHFGLAVLYRRMRRVGEALRSIIATLRCPCCFRGASFWGDTYLPTDHVNRQDHHKKCHHWLQQTRSDPTGLVADDPFFEARHRLKFASGLYAHDDFKVYDEIIDEYVHRGRPIEAIQLAMRYGELMMGETTPFRERENFTPARHRTRLRELFLAANLADRVTLVDSV